MWQFMPVVSLGPSSGTDETSTLARFGCLPWGRETSGWSMPSLSLYRTPVILRLGGLRRHRADELELASASFFVFLRQDGIFMERGVGIAVECAAPTVMHFSL
jgi:hypothetical protein